MKVLEKIVVLFAKAFVGTSSKIVITLLDQCDRILGGSNMLVLMRSFSHSMWEDKG